MIEAEEFGLSLVEQPSRQRSGKTVGAAAAMVEDQGPGIVSVRAHEQLQRKNGFHG
jgi:hypothetical protein